MSTQTFDPQAFLEMPIDTPLEKRPPLPVRDYNAQILEVNPAVWESKDKTRSGMKYDVLLELSVPQDVQDGLGLAMPVFKLKDSIMLDLTDQGGLDSAPGRNRVLRNYREALDMNKAGQTFRAKDMIGRLIGVRLKHEDWQGAPQERVDAVVKAG